MVQVLKAKHDYTEALSACNKILEDLKPIASEISDSTTAIQLMAIAIGEISDIYESKNELQCALEYKKLQRLFLSYIKYQESLLIGEPYELEEDIMDKKELINKLNEIQNMTVHISKDPDEAMKQILESLERLKEKRINHALESIINPQNEMHQNSRDIELTKFERFIEFIFIHPFLFIIFFIIIFGILIFLITKHFQAKRKLPEDIKTHLKKVTNYISKVKDIKNQENLDKMINL